MPMFDDTVTVEVLMKRGLDRETAEFVLGPQWSPNDRRKIEKLAAPYLRPEQVAAAREMLHHPETVTWLPEMASPEPGAAVGYALDALATAEREIERITGIDLLEGDGEFDDDEALTDIYFRMRADMNRVFDRAGELEKRLKAEGEHTAAANAEIDRLKAVLERASSPVGWGTDHASKD